MNIIIFKCFYSKGLRGDYPPLMGKGYFFIKGAIIAPLNPHLWM
tara:strand:+ start:638 stop:769 length:132 start_codon:yes stop_codon:yes gene_type:complete